MKSYSISIILLIITINTTKAQSYRFIGDGSWRNPSNWSNSIIPPNELQAGSSIEIDPSTNGQCILDTVQIILPGAIFTVKTNAKLIILSYLINENSNQDFYMDSTDVNFLDSIGVPNPTLQEILGVDGNPIARTDGITNVLSTRETLIKNLLTYAQLLSDQKVNITHPQGSVTEPEHNGFAYSYGDNKDLTTRHTPNAGNTLHKTYSVYGTDCTGLLYNLLQHEGINISISSANGFESALRASLANNSTYSSLKLTNFHNLPLGQIQSGDFIVWNQMGHDGIICNLYNLQRLVYNSNGTPNPTSYNDQVKNWGPKRGIHPLSFDAVISSGYPWGTDYEILRIEDSSDSTFVDARDGQQYTFRHIGSQVWMTKNLNFASGACYSGNTSYCSVYGRLYDWNTAMTIAPAGWHLPSDAEWTTLTNYLGGESVAGGAMKSNMFWTAPNTGANNSSGFSGLPAGELFLYDGQYYYLGQRAIWWSSTMYDASNIWVRSLNYQSQAVTRVQYTTSNFSFPIRCVRN